MYLGKVKSGEVWFTSGRKGPLTIKFMEDVDMSKDSFFEAQIVAGTAKFLSFDYKLAQRVNGLGTPGTVMSFRTTLTELVGEVKEGQDAVRVSSESAGAGARPAGKKRVARRSPNKR